MRVRSYASPEVDGTGLEQAFDAFRAGDLPRAVELVLAREAGGTLRSSSGADGPGWVAVVHGAPVFVTLRGEEASLEAPIARLPARRRLPALRLALELCAADHAAARVSLRGDLLLLRFTARVSPQLTPAVLRHHLREVGLLAARYAGLMIAGLDALPAAAGLEPIGRPRRMILGEGGPRPAEDRAPASSLLKPGSRPGMPAVAFAPPGAEPIPAVLAPPRSERITPEQQRSIDRSRADTKRIPRPIAPSVDETPRAPVAMGPQAAPPFQAGSQASPGPGPARPGQIAMESSAPPARAGDPPGLAPADRLCMLLRNAQSLATLALEERPPTMTWVVRAAVFRAIYDFRDQLPDAISHLYRCTGVAKEGPASRTSGQLQAAEPVMVVMERIIVARGQMPKERPLAIEPMTSAAQAREHVSRFLSEIERAPGDPALRHFLALGALTELLVRTKLPPQTDQRLRDIVAHAQREGARGSSLELMMTALQRINA